MLNIINWKNEILAFLAFFLLVSTLGLVLSRYSYLSNNAYLISQDRLLSSLDVDPFNTDEFGVLVTRYLSDEKISIYEATHLSTLIKSENIESISFTKLNAQAAIVTLLSKVPITGDIFGVTWDIAYVSSLYSKDQILIDEQ